MRGDKPAIEQLTYGPIGTSSTWGAWLDGKQFAQMNGCPDGYAVRWIFLDWRQKGATTIHADQAPRSSTSANGSCAQRKDRLLKKTC